jgi:hypothetical protein
VFFIGTSARYRRTLYTEPKFTDGLVTVTLKLKPEVEARALEQAAKRGVSAKASWSLSLMMVRGQGSEALLSEREGGRIGNCAG